MSYTSQPARIPGQRIEPVVQGEYKISSDPTVVLSTVLGSCVAVCLYDTEARIGGMNHYLLAVGGTPGSREVKYGAMAMELLVNGLLKAGANRRRLQAKLFGGARVTASFASIGEANARFGREFLDREGFEIRAESLGGTNARRVHFHPASGAAWLMVVPSSAVASEKPPTEIPVRPPSQVTLF
ncbi:MAG: chemotaxis protein CheD [Rhodobacteraceae bacterium]|jgi:chemotaxis protein CheD|nr:chemotaxis protein CheD [Paracoccaceae bacterium]